MAKSTKNQKTDFVDVSNGKGLQHSQSEIHDDFPLPNPDDLKKFQEVESEIVPWLMRMSENEQSFRHSYENTRNNIINDVNNKLYRVDLFRIFSALFIVIFGFCVSGFLILKDKDTIGTIFASTTMISAVGMFLNLRNNKTNPPK